MCRIRVTHDSAPKIKGRRGAVFHLCWSSEEVRRGGRAKESKRERVVNRFV